MSVIISFLTLLGWVIFISLLLSLSNIKYNKLFEIFGWMFTSVSLFIFSYYAFFEQQSIVQSSISFISGFLTILILYLIIKNKLQIHQTKIFITISSGILLFSYTITMIQTALIYNVATETQFLLQILGYDTILENGTDGIYIVFTETDLRTEIIMACTGIGSIALFTGFISAIDSLDIKLKLLYISLSSITIYLLNLVRNVFIAGAYGGQWFHIQPEFIEYIFGRGDDWVSFYIADRIIAQIGSVIIMVLFAMWIIKFIDDKTTLIEEWVNIIDYTTNIL